jgi:hypothetical protein
MGRALAAMMRWWNVTPDEYNDKTAEVQEFMMTAWLTRDKAPGDMAGGDIKAKNARRTRR